MNDKELREIRERCNAATPGPWHWADMEKGVKQLQGAVRYPAMCPVLVPYVCPACAERGAECLGPCPADAKFIKHARMDIPKLLDEIERLQSGREWISVKDGLPKAPGAYFVSVHTNLGKIRTMVCFYDPQYKRPWNMPHYYPMPTHWMPLPEPPEEDNDA